MVNMYWACRLPPFPFRSKTLFHDGHSSAPTSARICVATFLQPGYKLDFHNTCEIVSSGLKLNKTYFINTPP